MDPEPDLNPSGTARNGKLGEESSRGRTASVSSISKDQFEFGQILGEGAFGQVRLCKKKDNGCIYAAKILRKEQLIRAKQTKYVKSEKSILSTLSHPNISRLFFTFADSKKLYLVMELVSGGELFSHIRDSSFTIPLLDVVRFYAAELLLALEYTHSRGVVHRDIKPENLLLDGTGHLKLVDFGIAKKIEGPGLHTFCGTAEYLAPEVLKNSTYDFGVDWWAYGCVVYEALVGTSPFFASSVTLTYQKIVSREVYWPRDMHPDAKDLIDKLLSPDISKRLGCSAEKGFSQEVREHPFFKGIVFESISTSDTPIKPPQRATIVEASDMDRQEDSESLWNVARQKTQIQIEKYRARSIISHSDPQQIARAKDIQRRSAMLRDMYPELNRLPLRPPPVPMDVGPAYASVFVKDEVCQDVVSSVSANQSTAVSDKHSASDPLSLHHVRTFVNLKAPVKCLSWDPKAPNLAVSGGFFVSVLNTSSLDSGTDDGRLWEDFRIESGSSSQFLEYAPSGECFVYDRQRQLGLCTVPDGSDSKYSSTSLIGHNLAVGSVVFNATSELLASGGSDQYVFIWNVSRQKYTQKLKAHVSYIAALAWSGDNLVSGGGDSRIVLFDSCVGRIKQFVDYHKGAILSLDWRYELNAASNILASSGLDRKVLFLDSRSWSSVNVLVFPSPVSKVLFSPNGEYFATAGKDAVRLWSYKTMQVVAVFRGDHVSGSPISWSHDSRYFATVDDRNIPIVYDLSTFGVLPSSSLEQVHTSPITVVRWAPKSPVLAVGSLDKSVSFWKPSANR
eukprot:ANDGO_05995.mRNA.1 cAMP-dependent protein kinase type 3